MALVKEALAMPTAQVRVAVNGFGVIGMRVSDAVALQDDMDLVGVADVATGYWVRVAVERGYPVFAADASAVDQLHAAGIPVAGTLDDVLARVDVIADCTSSGLPLPTRTATWRAAVKAVGRRREA